MSKLDRDVTDVTKNKLSDSSNQDAAKPVVLVSATDAYIHDRMKEGPKNLEEVEVKLGRDHYEPAHVLELPKEVKRYEDNYVFRWINKNPRAISRALDVIGWTLVNRVFFKDISNHLFTANGSIERGECILTFMPRKQAEEIRAAPGKLSRERVKNTPVQNLRNWKDRGESYYNPDIEAAENDVKPRGIFRQPDLEEIQAV